MLRIIYVLIIISLTNLIIAQDTLFDLSKLKQMERAQTVKLENGLTIICLKTDDSSRFVFRSYTNVPGYVDKSYQSVLSVDAELRKNTKLNLPNPWTQQGLSSLDIELKKNEKGIYGSCQASSLDTLLYLISDLFQKPVIRGSEIVKAKKRVVSKSDSIELQPSFKIDKVTKSIIYGKGHPMLRRVDKSQLNLINVEKYNEYYEKFYRPANSYLLVVGAIGVDSLKVLAEKAFISWKKKAPPSSTYKLIPIREPKIVFFDTIPDGKTNIKIMFPFALHPFSFNSEQAEVLSLLFQDLLSERLIDKMKLANKIEAKFESDKITGNYQLNVQLEKDSLKLVVGAIISTLAELRDVKYPMGKLEKAKNEVIKKFKSKETSDEYISWLIIDSERNDLQKSYYSNFIEGINGLNQSSMRTLAAKYLNYRTALFQIPGHWYQSLNEFIWLCKDFRIELYNLNGSIEKVIPKGFDGFSVVDNYIEAVGGMKTISRTKDVTVNYNAIYELSDDKNIFVEGEMKHKSENRYYSYSRMIRQDLDTIFLHMQIFDGQNGLDSTMQGKKRIGRAKLELLKYKSPFVPEVQYKAWKYKARLSYADTLNGAWVWVVVMDNPAKQRIIDFYDVDKGIRYKRIITDDNYYNNRTIEYSRYNRHEGEGILYPYFKKITTKEAVIKMVVKEINYKKNERKLFEVE